jgi:hypothetical protein
MKIVKKIDDKHFLGEEDGEKVLLVKKDLDLEALAEALADDEDPEEEEAPKKGKKEEVKKETKKPAKKEEPEEEDEDDDEDEYTWEDIKDMDYEELSELVDDEELEDIDVEDYDEDDDDEVEKLRVAIAKELDIEVPKKGKKGKK